MREVLDIREVAKVIFATAKEILQQEGSLRPVRLSLNAAGELKGEREAAQRTQGAADVAVFTICETTYQVFEPHRLPAGESGEMPYGWIKDHQRHDCFHMRLEVLGQEPTCIVVPFRRCPDGTLEFGEQWEGPEHIEGPPPPTCEGNEGAEN